MYIASSRRNGSGEKVFKHFSLVFCSKWGWYFMKVTKILSVFIVFFILISFVSALNISISDSITNDDDIDAVISFDSNEDEYCLLVGTSVNADTCGSFSAVPDSNSLTYNLASDITGVGTYTIIVIEQTPSDINTTDSDTFIYDLNNPTDLNVSSNYKNNYTNDTTPTITLKATDAEMDAGVAWLSCDDSFGAGEYKVINLTDSTTTTDEFDITETDYECTDDANRTIYAKFTDAAGNQNSTPAITSILYDGDKPATPSGLKVTSVGDGEVTLSWTEPTADTLSGSNLIIIEYGLEEAFDEDDTVDADETTATIDGLENGELYTIRIRLKDNAGNESNASSEVEATPQDVSATLTVKKGSSDVTFAKNNDTLAIKCSYSDEVSEAIIAYKYNGETTEELATEDNVDEISGSLKISGDFEDITFYCKDGGSSIQNKKIELDNILPVVEITDTNTLFSGTKKVEATVTEENLDSVVLNINGTNYTMVKENSKYKYDLNTKTIENGNYALSVKATDKAGNEKTATLNIIILNELTPKQAAQKAIDEARAKQLLVEDAFKYLQSQGIEINSNAVNKKVEADVLLEKAITDLNSDSVSSKTTAESSKAKYTEILSSTTTQTIGTQNYTNQLGQVTTALTGFGMNPLDANESEDFSQNNLRKLNIIKVGTQEEYHTIIELTIKNDTNEGTIKVIEIIPKSFAEFASEIFSDTNFVVLQDDPVIEFTIDLAPGTTKTIFYGSGILTKTEADLIQDNNVLASFASSPITVREDIDTMKLVQQANLNGIIMIIGVIIVVLIIIAIIGFIGIQVANKGHGFGTKTKTPSEAKKDESWPKK